MEVQNKQKFTFQSCSCDDFDEFSQKWFEYFYI